MLNWTHRDSLGAVNVKVGVGYNSDPDQVIAILTKCAEEHPEVLRTPAPGASLEGFGDSALLFNLRVSLPDIDKAGGVQSDLRIAIFKALGAAGIEIPFNQLDVNLRDLEMDQGLPVGGAGAASQRRYARRSPAYRERRASMPARRSSRRLQVTSPLQSSRNTFSRRSWRSWASSDSVAMGRASRRFNPIGSPVSSQYP